MKIFRDSLHFYRVIIRVIFSSSFVNVTIFGNIIIIGSSLIFYVLEQNINSQVTSMLDAIWWGFATATTVGYGDIVPLTDKGKVLGIFLMLAGTTLFATYTALIAQTIIEDDILKLTIINRKNKRVNKSKSIDELRSEKVALEVRIRELEGS